PLLPYTTLFRSTSQSSACPTLLLLPTREGTFNGERHFFHHLRFGKTAPAVTAARSIDDSRVSRWLSLLKKLVEQMNRCIQIVTVRLTHGNVDFGPKLRSNRLPVLLEY